MRNLWKRIFFPSPAAALCLALCRALLAPWGLSCALGRVCSSGAAVAGTAAQHPGLAGSQRQGHAGLTPLCSEHETNEAEAADLWLPAGQQFQPATWPLCGSEMWPQVGFCSIPLSVPSLLPSGCNRTLGPPGWVLLSPSPPEMRGRSRGGKQEQVLRQCKAHPASEAMLNGDSQPSPAARFLPQAPSSLCSY